MLQSTETPTRTLAVSPPMDKKFGQIKPCYGMAWPPKSAACGDKIDTAPGNVPK